MSHDLVFYTNPMSRGRIVRWMLEECHVSYDTVLLEYGSMMKSAEYLAINPMGKVPAIVHKGHIVTEAAAICTYLADVFPEAELAPEVSDRHDYYRWLFYAAGPVEAAVMNNAMKFEAAEGSEQTLGYGSFVEVMDTLERLLSDRHYVTGNRFTAADVYVGSSISWGLQFGTMESRDGFAEYVDRLTSREAWVRANELDNAAMASSA